MSAKNVLGIIFSNAYDEALPQLTAFRTMGSIPFASQNSTHRSVAGLR